MNAVADLDTAVTENTLFRYPLLECYGGMQLALGKHEENAFDVVKDKDGYLHGGNFWTGFGDDTKELAVRVRRLADAMEERGTKVGFVLPPMKVVRQQALIRGFPTMILQSRRIPCCAGCGIIACLIWICGSR